MSDSIEKYKKYDWKNDSNYQNYLQSLYPTPSYDKLEKLRRKWYKKNIDLDFDVDFDAQQQQQQQQQQSQQTSQQQQQGSQNQQQQQQANAGTQSKGLLYTIEGQCKLVFFPSVIFGQYFFAGLLIIAISLLQIIRNKGMIKFNAEYAQKALPTEFFSNIFWAISLIIPPGRSSYVWFLPIGLQMLSGVSEYMQSTDHILIRKVPKAKEFLAYIKQNRNQLMQMKQKLEIYLFFYTIVGTFLGFSSFIQIIIMVQYLALKNKVNRNMQYANWELNNQMNALQARAGPAKIIVNKFQWLYNKVLNFI